MLLEYANVNTPCNSLLVLISVRSFRFLGFTVFAQEEANLLDRVNTIITLLLTAGMYSSKSLFTTRVCIYVVWSLATIIAMCVIAKLTLRSSSSNLFHNNQSGIQVRDWRQHAQGKGTLNESLSLRDDASSRTPPESSWSQRVCSLASLAPPQVGYNTSMDRFFLFNMTTLFLLVVVSTMWSIFNGSVDPRLAEANCTLAGVMTCTLNNLLCIGSLFAFFALNIAW